MTRKGDRTELARQQRSAGVCIVFFCGGVRLQRELSRNFMSEPGIPAGLGRGSIPLVIDKVEEIRLEILGCS
jgi:hypothetical protein